MAWAELLNTTSALPRQNPATASRAMPAAFVTTSSATSATTAHWTAWARHISVARSYRSTSAPPGSDSSSHGRNVAAVTTETSRGSLVIVTASSGSAAANAPSPVVLTELAHHRRQYGIRVRENSRGQHRHNARGGR